MPAGPRPAVDQQHPQAPPDPSGGACFCIYGSPSLQPYALAWGWRRTGDTMGTTPVRAALERPVTLTREDAWHQAPRTRLQELAREVRELQGQVQRANLAVGQGAGGGNLRVLRSTLSHLEGRLLQRRRYVVTFRRHHRI